MIVLFGSHYGSDTSELDSGYLLWIIEKYESADWTLLNACKSELASRLKLDWHKPTDPETELQEKLDKAAKRIMELESRANQLTDLLGIAVLSKGNPYLVNLCESNPSMVQDIIEGTKLRNGL